MKSKQIVTLLAGLVMIALVSASAKLTDSPHEKLSFDCEECHNSESFTDINFDHEKKTGYPLEGHHAVGDCRGCHSIEDFSSVGENCLSCHKDIHEAKLGNDCQQCHTPSGWQALDIFEIHSNSDFLIIGRHASLDCRSCHVGFPMGDLTHTDSRCVACHQSDYLGTTSPSHVSAGFSTDCENCHQMNTFRPAQLPDHDIFFPIFSGNHQGVWNECATCHINSDQYADFSCLTCHEHRQEEMDPTHNGIAGYAYNSPDCYSCHPTGEADSFTDHDAQFFPIFSGIHQGEWDACNTCHVVPTDRKVVDCLGCHEHRQSEMDGKHGGMTGYAYTSTACLECHPTGEKGTFTAHDVEFFPIFSGTHNTAWAECATCHTVPGDRSTFECTVCHEHEQTPMDGTHDGITGYEFNSAACLMCHPTGEKGEFTDHDAQFFPIFSGRHNAVWDDCATCHTVAIDRTVFDCTGCHEHEQTAMDGVHGTMTGYEYASSACYTCHPTGEAGDFAAHDAEFFPIFSGTHNSVWADCTTCHNVPTDRTVYDCLGCHEHRQSEMDGMHGTMSGYSYVSTACYGCHPTGEKGTFTAHDAEFFPIFSGAHAGRWSDCATCHDVQSDRSQFTCFNCHEHDQSLMDEHHLGRVSGYVYESAACYDCHPDGRSGD